jgi:uncharacterized membrane protein YhaH (DUF805 family)
VNNKKFIIPGIAAVLALPSVFAATPLAPLGTALGSFTRFIFIDFKGYVGGDEYFIRILLWLLLFALFFAILKNLGEKSPFKRKNIAMTVSMILSLICAIFIPAPYVFLIAHSYGFVSSFILLAVPLVAIILLGHFVFPTTEAKEKDVGKRRINHAIKAIMYYFLSTLITNYSGAITAAKPTGFDDVYNITVSICMVLFLYHIIMAIFTSAGGYKKEEGEGWFEGMLKGKEEAAPSGGGLEGGGKEKGGEEGPDLGPIIARISDLNQKTEQFSQQAQSFLNNSEIIRRVSEEDFDTSEDVQKFLEQARALRAMGSQLESTAHSISDMTELFQNLRNEQIVALADVVRRIETAEEMIIDGIINTAR